jgi:hypothetical protein
VLRGEIGRLFLEDRAHDLDRGIALEGDLAGEHLPQDGPEGEDVRAWIHLLAPDLLRRHVSHGPQYGPRRRAFGQLGGRAVQVGDGSGLRQTEIQDLDPAIGQQEYVRRL